MDSRILEKLGLQSQDILKQLLQTRDAFKNSEEKH
ncbi:hypothetical protein BTU51_0551 [Rickettsia rickettsii]|uniref:Uncharacterized protein n=1 Tax=Rickettsia rickettsii (strain Iowa) TaxID=452659 RepID=B0BX49_RICRO|nr:hypothetical protein RrIowa_0551 [Rickettsia rickettsii str. Iowa]APU55377.1 hypothetical protein BTU50_0551 [Rickettsia rickettsii]APU56754.1 hypothetical protein BTU51_0551 [Rickettsia rickettsii]